MSVSVAKKNSRKSFIQKKLDMNPNLWYLVEDLASLSFFISDTCLQVKAKVSDALNQQITQDQIKFCNFKDKLSKLSDFATE